VFARSADPNHPKPSHRRTTLAALEEIRPVSSRHPIAPAPILVFAVVLAGSTLLARGGLAQVVIPPDFHLSVVAEGLDQPVNFDVLPDGRILVAEQHSGRIRLIDPGISDVPIVGTVGDLRTGVFDGLLGIAVDPRWPTAPYVYTHSVAVSSPNIRILRHTVTGDLAGTGARNLLIDPYLERPILTDLPSDNDLHHGGTLEFGPDGMLYIAVGDDSWSCAAQDVDQLRGKILRLDVSSVPAGPGPAPSYYSLAPWDNPFRFDPDMRTRLVYHYGLRNPWAFDFDRESGAMVIADVGLDRWEEVNLASQPGRNFGWPLLEGAEPYLKCDEVEPESLTAPAFAYEHDSTAVAVTIGIGGVARPSEAFGAFPIGYWGQVFYYDFFAGELRRLQCAGGTCASAPAVPGEPAPNCWGTGFGGVTRMRFLADGALWFLQGPQLRRIHHGGAVAVEPRPLPAEVRLAAFPSPARGPVVIEFLGPAGGSTALTILDVAGRTVRRLDFGRAEPGTPVRVTWDGRTDGGNDAGSGVFFAALDHEGGRATRRIVRLKG
jgi:glucose/arabinose dehydrogenase